MTNEDDVQRKGRVLRLDPALDRALTMAAAAAGVSVNRYVTELIAGHLPQMQRDIAAASARLADLNRETPR